MRSTSVRLERYAIDADPADSLAKYSKARVYRVRGSEFRNLEALKRELSELASVNEVVSRADGWLIINLNVEYDWNEVGKDIAVLIWGHVNTRGKRSMKEVNGHFRRYWYLYLILACFAILGVAILLSEIFK